MKIAFIFDSTNHSTIHWLKDPDLLSRFVAQIEQRAGIRIEQLDRPPPASLPVDGFLMLAPSVAPTSLLELVPMDQRPALAARLVPIVGDLSHEQIFALLEAHACAAAIDAMSVHDWESRIKVFLGSMGPHGQRRIAPMVSAECGRFESERYCYLRSATHEGLPHLLVDYLRALEPLLAQATKVT